MNAIPASALALTMAACGTEAPLGTQSSESFGVAGSTVTIADPELKKFSTGINNAMDELYRRGVCTINVTVNDLKKHPDLENINNRGRAAGRGFPGGELYLSSDIDPAKEKLPIYDLTAHEGGHACVTTGREFTEEITAPRSDLKVRFAHGFYLEVDDSPDAPGTGSLDEAAVEWMKQEVIDMPSPISSEYAGTTQLFGAFAAERGISLTTVADLHRESNVPGIVQELTGETPTADRIGCVVLEFVKVQTRATAVDAAARAIRNC